MSKEKDRKNVPVGAGDSTEDADGTAAHAIHLKEEIALWDKLATNAVVHGAVSDWEQIRGICIAVIRELLPYMPKKLIYRLVLGIVKHYDTHVISVFRRYSDVERLAMFVNEMIRTLLDVPAYVEALNKRFNLDQASNTVHRGIVLEQITTEQVRRILDEDPRRYFRTEADSARQHRAANRLYIREHNRGNQTLHSPTPHDREARSA